MSSETPGDFPVDYPVLPPHNSDSDSDHEFFEEASSPPPPPAPPAPVPAPSSSRMSTSSVWKKSTIKTDSSVLKTLRVDNIQPLEGTQNYTDWVSSMNLIWRAMKCYEIVVKGAKPPPEVSPEDQEVYDSLCDYAAATFINVVSPTILVRISDLEHPHKMWTFLRQEYFRDSSTALIGALYSFYHHEHDPSKSVQDNIKEYEERFQKLYTIARSGNQTYKKHLLDLMDDDNYKKDAFLSPIRKYKPDLADLLTMKTEVTFSDAKIRLLETDDLPSSSEAALAATKGKKAFNNKGTAQKKATTPQQQQKGQDAPNECNWCKKHRKEGNPKGHVWQSCTYLVEFKKKKAAEKEKKTENANVGIAQGDEQVSPSFYLDTGATSHMVPSADRLENVSKCSGSVKTSGGHLVPILGV